MFQNSRKESKALMAIGTLCLALALLLRLAMPPLAGDLVHAVMGMLLGISIVFNIAAVVKKRRSACFRR
ncbi:MAG: hypothetical protein ABSB67_23805 [Bryobacteraceae bacterium]|jgi:uncharacterized membrane protein HdeD (DUF308 family)